MSERPGRTGQPQGRSVAIVSAFPPAQDGVAHYTGEVFSAYARENRSARLRVYTRSLITDRIPATPPNMDVVTLAGGDAGRIRRTTSMWSVLPRIRAFEPDVVHLQGTHVPIYGGIWGEPMLQVVRGLRRRGIPVVHTAHSTWLPDDIARLVESKRLPPTVRRGMVRYYGWFWRTMAAHVSELRLATAGEGAPILAEFISAWGLEGRCEIVPEPHPCGGAAHQRDIDGWPRPPRGGRCIAAIGFVRPDKNYHALLDVADDLLEAVPDAWIIIAGQPSGPAGEAYAAEMLARRDRLRHSGRVHLEFEYVPDRELQRYFLAADIVVVPYARVIGPSGPVHHALSFGKAVVASALGHNLGLRGVIELFDPQDPGSLGSTIGELLRAPARIEALEAAAGSYAREHTWASLSQDYEATYQRVAPSPTGYGSSPTRRTVQ